MADDGSTGAGEGRGSGTSANVGAPGTGGVNDGVNNEMAYSLRAYSRAVPVGGREVQRDLTMPGKVAEPYPHSPRRDAGNEVWGSKPVKWVVKRTECGWWWWVVMSTSLTLLPQFRRLQIHVLVVQ